jgi:signal transduction histidine kinase/CheY-like chemotaxis protein
MIRNLKDTTQKNSEQDWLKTNLAKFSRMLQGQRDLLTVSRMILSELVPVVSAQQAVFYTLDNSGGEPELKMLASYACKPKTTEKTLKLGEGLVGQCAFEKRKILLTQVPKKYLSIFSGLGESAAASIIVLPVLFEGLVKGVLELASFEKFSSTHQALLDQLTESIGIVLNTIEANTLTEDLLVQSQSLAGELQSQQEELRKTNQELEEKAALLVEQNKEVERKNEEVEQARLALEEKAEQLALTSKYKSEFLANMSHELRTPLNSLLILSDQLSKNPEGNLSPRQTEFAKTIHASGKELLTLINDILDLSKIESGTVVVDVGELRFPDLIDYVERTFRYVAEAKGVGFGIRIGSGVPRSLYTDSMRFQQVIKNLLSNAFKFTERGQVTLAVDAVREGWNPQIESLNRARCVLAVSVTDTGIGISPEKQQIIFEAFQQADGSTSRKYGGTGLGLAISREIARLLGGEIRLTSVPGQGSTFTLFLPQVYVAPVSARSLSEAPGERVVALLPQGPAEPAQAESDVFPGDFPDDRSDLLPEDRVLLIIDNDESFAGFLLEMAHENGFKAVIATQGAEGIALARRHRIDAITLDIRLPVMDGWRVLDRLKNDLETRHLPVYLISTEEDAVRGLSRGAIGALVKPIQEKEELDAVFRTLREMLDRREKDLLVLSVEEGEAARVARGLSTAGVRTRKVSSEAQALGALDEQRFDGVVVEVPAGAEGLEDLEEIARRCGSRSIPLFVFTPGPVSEKAEADLERASRLATVRRVRAVDRLADQIALSMHLPIGSLAEENREQLARLYSNSILAGKRVLIVDDDIRNIFAITSVLERQSMSVVPAETGQEAIEKLQSSDGIDIVLMDIMMPGMDGYDTMRAIRKIERLKTLPIIAVTAKAMKGDREKTLQAGAWDYLAKPVDADQMLSVMRAWLHP